MSIDSHFDFVSGLARPGTAKILLCVLDGLGGMPGGLENQTELEGARTPHMDTIAPKCTFGLIDPVAPGITPGSGPGHLGLFGYDPEKFVIGRGVLSAAGLGLEMGSGDMAARINFCTVDEKGVVTDRRAGRIPTETCTKLCEKLAKEIKLDGIEIVVKPEREHRAAVVFRGQGLDPGICDTDPQQEGLPPVAAAPKAGHEAKAGPTAKMVRQFLEQARKVLANEKPANMILLRGFDQPPHLPKLGDAFKLKAAAIAVYPMYRGLARLVGMDVIEFKGETLTDEVHALEKALKDYDFFYMHVKKTDSAGEDGKRDAKIHVIEDFDLVVPRLLAMRFGALIITGDHSTPAGLKSHSWHPSPVLLNSPNSRHDGLARFTETNCARGGLGHIRAIDLMPLALGHAMRLDKFGA